MFVTIIQKNASKSSFQISANQLLQTLSISRTGEGMRLRLRRCNDMSRFLFWLRQISDPFIDLKVSALIQTYSLCIIIIIMISLIETAKRKVSRPENYRLGKQKPDKVLLKLSLPLTWLVRR